MSKGSRRVGFCSISKTMAGAGHQLIFSKTASQLREAMVSVAQKCALQPLGDPYRLRHGGASRDFATGDRKQPNIQRRGRWKTAKSTRRYEKGGRLGQLMRSLSQKVRDAAYKAAARIEKTAQCRRWVLANLWSPWCSWRSSLVQADWAQQ